jgi:hypothetical protein
MWFLSPDTPELLIKIFPTCATGYYWVFASAATNAGVMITITAMGTGAQKVYTNRDIHPMIPIQDQTAFPCVSVPPVDPLLPNTQLLLAYWHLVETICTSVFTDDYTLTNIDGTKNDEGGYHVDGTDEYAGTVAASYYPNETYWAFFDPSDDTFDNCFVFFTDGTSILPGSCHYLVYHDGHWSNCYPLRGERQWRPLPSRSAKTVVSELRKEPSGPRRQKPCDKTRFRSTQMWSRSTAS